MNNQSGTLLRRSQSWPCPRPAQFAVLLVRARRDVLLHLSGELDRESRDAFDACVASVLAEQPRRLVLDLSGLSSVDLVGVGCFSDAQRSAELAGVQLVLDSPNEMVLAMLDGADAGRAFSIR